ncbi:MAG: GntR family transcriptional regulator [Micrococcales bacterium]|nr:GntR family transcriptional regulator [Micrococcales bacterium]
MPAKRTLDGVVPKHQQLRDALARLAREELAPGDTIPSERELMVTYAVSRDTVRKAIAALVTDGLLVRAHGKGTFVALPRIESHLHLASFTKDMRRRGLEPTTLVLGARLAPAPLPVLDFLGGAPRDEHWRLERMRLADGQPMAHELSWCSATALPDLGRHDLTGSVYAVLAEHYGYAIDQAEQTTWAEVPDEPMSRLLDLPEHTAVLLFHRQSTAAGTPLESVLSTYRGDRYSLHMSLDSSMPSDAPHPPNRKAAR